MNVKEIYVSDLVFEAQSVLFRQKFRGHVRELLDAANSARF